MRRRPNVFSQEDFEASLRRQGCAESFIAPTTSDFRLFVPLLIRELGKEKTLAIVNNARKELRLGEQSDPWRQELTYIIGWAEEQIQNYNAQK